MVWKLKEREMQENFERKVEELLLMLKQQICGNLSEMEF